MQSDNGATQRLERDAHYVNMVEEARVAYYVNMLEEGLKEPSYVERCRVADEELRRGVREEYTQKIREAMERTKRGERTFQ